MVVRNPLGSLFFRPFTERFDPLHRYRLLGTEAAQTSPGLPEIPSAGLFASNPKEKEGMRKTSTREWRSEE